MKHVVAMACVAALTLSAGLAAAAPSALEDFRVDMRRSEGIMAYRVVADTAGHRAPPPFFSSEREVVSAALEGELRERWIALLSSGFREGGECTPACTQCQDRVRYRLQFPPLSDSFMVAILWDDHRVLLFHDAKVVGHRWLDGTDTALVSLLQASFPGDTPTQLLRASDPGPRPAAPGPDDVVFIDALPEVTRRIDPHYPPSALMRGESGLVRVRALVGPKGRVLETRVESRPSDFDEAARVAVEGWRFKPARCGGTPVSVWVTLPIRFTFQAPGSR